jgi:hypothetical protein
MARNISRRVERQRRRRQSLAASRGWQTRRRNADKTIVIREI